MFDVSVIIPARLESGRLPKKLMQEIYEGTTVIESTVLHTRKACPELRTFVASDSSEIFNLFCNDYGMGVVNTSQTCKCGSDRVAEAAFTLKKNGRLNLTPESWIINIQGDFCIFPPHILREFRDAIYNFISTHSSAVLTERPFILTPNTELDKKKRNDPSSIKFYNNEYVREVPKGAKRVLDHIGMYAYNYKALEMIRDAKTLPEDTDLEQRKFERLGINMVYPFISSKDSRLHSVNTEEDLKEVQNLMVKAEVL